MVALIPTFTLQSIAKGKITCPLLKNAQNLFNLQFECGHEVFRQAAIGGFNVR